MATKKTRGREKAELAGRGVKHCQVCTLWYFLWGFFKVPFVHVLVLQHAQCIAHLHPVVLLMGLFNVLFVHVLV